MSLLRYPHVFILSIKRDGHTIEDELRLLSELRNEDMDLIMIQASKLEKVGNWG